MASEVDICNLALAHLGDIGNVASLNPPEGSAQAEHCARFYPVARDSLLSAHPWGFATKRKALAQVTDAPPGWGYAYAQPNDSLKVLTILAPGDPDPGASIPAGEPHIFVCEVNATDNRVIYCNVPQATAQYVARMTSPERFSPLFIMTLSWQLAAMLAGPVIKGDAGRAEAQRCTQIAQGYLGQAKEHDANQRSVRPQHSPAWIAARGAIHGGSTWGR